MVLTKLYDSECKPTVFQAEARVASLQGDRSAVFKRRLEEKQVRIIKLTTEELDGES